MTHRVSVTRRRFLKSSSAIVSAPLVLPAASLGKGNRPAPSERVTVGMLGVGRQAYIVNLGRQFLKMPDVQVVALCDVDRWRLDEGRKLVEQTYAKGTSAETYGGVLTTRDYREVLEREDVDAVMISACDHWHTPMALAALAAGKHVSLEKPITRSIAEGRRIVQAVRQHDRVFRMDSEMRSLGHFHRMAELVRNGRLGRIKAVRVGVPAGDNVACPPTPEMPVPKDLDYDRWQGPAERAPYTQERVHPPREFGRPGWMRVLNYCDGMLTNWGTHFIDIAHWCVDKERTGPVEIEGQGLWPPRGQLWNVLRTHEVTYRFADGVPLYYENTRNPEITGVMDRCSAYVKVEGTRGWIYGAYGPQKLAAEPASILDEPLGEDDVRFPLKSDKQDFVDAIKTGGRTLEDEEVAQRTTSLCHLGHIAIHLNRKLTWDPEAERFVSDAAADAYIDKPITALPKWVS